MRHSQFTYSTVPVPRPVRVTAGRHASSPSGTSRRSDEVNDPRKDARIELAGKAAKKPATHFDPTANPPLLAPHVARREVNLDRKSDAEDEHASFSKTPAIRIQNVHPSFRSFSCLFARHYSSPIDYIAAMRNTVNFESLRPHYPIITSLAIYANYGYCPSELQVLALLRQTPSFTPVEL